MKKQFCMILVAIILSVAQLSSACVGRTLLIAVPNTASEKLLAEMISMFISERTGSAVKVQVYKDSKEIYRAIKQGDVNIVIENTDRALEVVGRPKESFSKGLMDAIKSSYRKNLNMVWLEPFGGPLYYAPVLTTETLANYPALPKLLNKLAGVLTSDNCAKLMKSAEPEEKAKKAAREFLKSKKLI